MGGSRQGSHKMTPEKPPRALWVVHGLEPPPRFFDNFQEMNKERYFVREGENKARNFELPNLRAFHPKCTCIAVCQQTVHFRSAIHTCRGSLVELSNFELGAVTVCEMLQNCHMFKTSKLENLQTFKTLKFFKTSTFKNYKTPKTWKTLQAPFVTETCTVQNFQILKNCAVVLCAPETKRARVLPAGPLKVRNCVVELTAIGEVHQR